MVIFLSRCQTKTLLATFEMGPILRRQEPKRFDSHGKKCLVLLRVHQVAKADLDETVSHWSATNIKSHLNMTAMHVPT